MGYAEILVVGAVIVIFFSARKLPDLMGAFGKSIKLFKSSLGGAPSDTDGTERPTRSVTELDRQNGPPKNDRK